VSSGRTRISAAALGTVEEQESKARRLAELVPARAFIDG
jgi:hypothetical protein